MSVQVKSVIVTEDLPILKLDKFGRIVGQIFPAAEDIQNKLGSEGLHVDLHNASNTHILKEGLQSLVTVT